MRRLRRLKGEVNARSRSEEHTSELQSRSDLVCRLLLEKKKKMKRKENLCNRVTNSQIVHNRQSTSPLLPIYVRTHNAAPSYVSLPLVYLNLDGVPCRT